MTSNADLPANAPTMARTATTAGGTEALILLPSEARGGCEEYALSMGRALVASFGTTAAAFPLRPQTADLAGDFERAGVRYVPLAIGERGHGSCRTFASHARRFRKTLRLLVALRPRVCLLVTPSIQYMLGSIYAAALLRIPAALCFQYVQNRYAFRPGELKYYRRAKATQAWIAVSEQNRRLLAESFHVPASTIHVVPNGVDGSRFQTTDDRRRDNRSRLRRSLGLPADAFLFVTVGAIRKQKGYDLVPPAFRVVARQHPAVHWVWIGDGPDRSGFDTAVAEHALTGRVHLVGHRHDIPDMLSACDAFVFPTRFEGQPFALLEAMAAGLPVLTSDASGITEVVQDRVHGLVFESGRPEAIAAAMRHALAYPGDMRDMARRAVAQAGRCSAGAMLDQTVRILADLRHGAD